MATNATTSSAIYHHGLPQCTNCGITGHLFKNCPSPVTSYGIIAVRYQHPAHQSAVYSPSPMMIPMISNDRIEFLMIRRKDSIAYLEFMRGKYNPHDEEYIGVLLSRMTIDEHSRLLSESFETLWNRMWGGVSHVKTHKSNFESSEKKYQHIRPRLSSWIEAHPSKWTDPEWGFPKGRRNPYELDIHCAIREFQEETGLKRTDFSVIQNTSCISETFFGSNHVHYCHKYYLAICHPHLHVEWNADNYHMSREIGGLQWCGLDEAIQKIRSDNIEKREILLKAGKIMKNFYPIDPHR